MICAFMKLICSFWTAYYARPSLIVNLVKLTLNMFIVLYVGGCPIADSTTAKPGIPSPLSPIGVEGLGRAAGPDLALVAPPFCVVLRAGGTAKDHLLQGRRPQC